MSAEETSLTAYTPPAGNLLEQGFRGKDQPGSKPLTEGQLEFLGRLDEDINIALMNLHKPRPTLKETWEELSRQQVAASVRRSQQQTFTIPFRVGE